MNLRLRVLSFVAFSIVCLLQANLNAQAPVCDSGGICGTDPKLNTNPSYAGILPSRSMKHNARGSHNPMLVVPGSPGIVPRVAGSQSYNKAIPILSLPGRGLDLDLTLYYNSRIWTVDTIHSTISLNPDRDFPSYGFRLDFGFMEYDQQNAQFILTENDGTKHSMPLTANTASGSVFDSNDGTFIEFNNQSLVLTYKNGRTVKYQPFPSQATLFRPVQIKDRNGNFISIAYVAGTGNDQHIDAITDTLGRVIKFVYDQNNHLFQITQVVSTSTDQTGTHVWATFAWASPPAILTYSFSGLTVISTSTSGSQFPALISCTYPNQTGYKFSYGAWGIVNRIDLFSSTGKVRSYESYNFPDASQPLSDAPRYTTMTVSPDGASTSIWAYSMLQSALGQVTSETVTDPFQTSDIINFNADGTPASAQIKDVNGKIFQSFAYTWKSVGLSRMIASVIKTDDVGNNATISYTYDSFGNVSDLAEGDFGNSVIRHTITAYMGAPYSTNHILDLPQSVQITDGNNVVRSRTEYSYDETVPSPIGSMQQNDSNITTPRGNQTSITRYADAITPGGAITRHFAYDSAGNTITAEVDCCSKKRFTFDPLTQYAYLSSEVRGPDNGQQFTIKYAFNADNGLIASTTNENNQTTSYERDTIYRLKTTHLPSSNGIAVSQTITYGDDLVTPTIKTSTSANSATTIETYDGLAHLIRKDLQDSGTGNLLSTTQIQYDSIWRPSARSNPYAPGEPLLWTNFTYDPLNRTTLISPPSGGSTHVDFLGNTVTRTDAAGKQKKQFFDALGRLVRIDEPGWGDALTAIDSISISGSERSASQPGERYCAQYTINGRCVDWEFNPPTTVYDQGNVTATINGTRYTSPYGASDNPGTVAANLAAKINADPGRMVSASASGSAINLYAVSPGSAGNNISVTVSSITTDTTDFATGSTSFSASTYTPTLSAGENAVTQDNAVLTATRHLTTTYTYDVNDRIRTVSQGAIGPIRGQQLPGQPRAYVYDDLGRLTTTTTPESGTETHYYTKTNGAACATDPMAVCRVADARGVLKTFSYVDSSGIADPLNRLRAIIYSDNTPGATYTYDVGGQTSFALGRIIAISESGNSLAFTYDNLGRITSVIHNIDGTNYQVQYAYNLASQITSMTYPSGRIVKADYHSVGFLRQIADANTPSNPYLQINNTDYTGAGEVKSLVYGNGIKGAATYNDHLQISTLRYFNPAAPTGTPDLLNLSYDYGTSNNGQIQVVHSYSAPSIEDTTKSETFTYDPWSRLSAAQTSRVDSTAGTWSLQWGYDRLGNRLQQTLVGGNVSIGQPNFIVNASTNQIISSGFTYDYAGNLTHDATAAYTYDGANRLTGVNNGSGVAAYTYFGPLRIKKVNGSTTTVSVYSGTKPIAEYVGGSVSKEFIYAGSTLLATLAGTGITYHHPDHLSNRAETDASGNPVRSFGHFPYGETWYETSADQQKFTIYPRDSGIGESGLDYAMFRHYNSGQGRFMSVDLLGGDLFAPQSLNRYSYVTGDPNNLIDPLGLCPFRTHPDDSQDGKCVVDDEGPPQGGGGVSSGGSGGSGGGGGPAPKKPDPKKEDSEACKKAKEALEEAEKEDRADAKHAMKALPRDVAIGAGIGCLVEGSAGTAIEPGGGTVLGCLDGAFNGAATALGVWFVGSVIEAGIDGWRSMRAFEKVEKECK